MELPSAEETEKALAKLTRAIADGMSEGYYRIQTMRDGHEKNIAPDKRKDWLEQQIQRIRNA